MYFVIQSMTTQLTIITVYVCMCLGDFTKNVLVEDVERNNGKDN